MKIFPHAEQFASLDLGYDVHGRWIAQCYSSFQKLIAAMVTIGNTSCTDEGVMGMH